MTKPASVDPIATMPKPSRRERLQALLFSAGAMGTALTVLTLLAETKLPRQQGE